MNMTSHTRPVIFISILVWLAGVSIYAFYYVNSRLEIQGLEGYEKEWSWQLLFFGITRLPLLVAVLVILLIVEWRLLKRRD